MIGGYETRLLTSCIFLILKKRAQYWCVWETLSTAVTVKMSSPPLRMAHTVTFFLRPFTSNMQPKLDSQSSSLGVWSAHITWGEGVCIFHTRTAWREIRLHVSRQSVSHKQHADTPKQGLHSPQMFLNLDESQSNWHCLKQARRPFGSLRPGLRG